MNKFTALISDLDDTLLNREHQMTDFTAAVLKRLQAQGAKIVLASGRSAAAMRPFVQKSGTHSPYIAYNGAQIVHPTTCEVLMAEEIDIPLAKETLSWLKSENMYAMIYDGDDWFYDIKCQFADDYGHSTGIVGTYVQSLLDFIHSPTPKLLAIGTPERVCELIETGREKFGDALSITTSKPHFLEITSPRATKGNAVKTLATMIGLSPETTLVAGDSQNDLSMLTWSKYPITVQNAREEIRQIAWRIGIDANENGLALLLDELIPEDCHAD